MSKDEWSFEANMDRGCLPTGEPLEALYGVGPWTVEPEPKPRVVQCPECDGHAYELAWNRIDCENCGKITLKFDDEDEPDEENMRVNLTIDDMEWEAEMVFGYDGWDDDEGAE